MSFYVENSAIQIVSAPIRVDFTTQNYHQINFVLSLSGLITQTGTLTGDDQNNDGGIQLDETIDHDNGGIPLLDPIPDLNNATVEAVGYMGGLVAGLLVRYPVLLVKSGPDQFIIYPEGPPDILTNITGALNTVLHLYKRGTWSPGDGLDVPCFARGTLIETDKGEVPIENLRCGDRVRTLDHGFQEIRWIGNRLLSNIDLQVKENLYPIHIRAGALGRNLPRSDLLVSPQHRILVRSKIAHRIFGTEEVLVSAKQLLAIEGIDIDDQVKQVDYFHILFDHHEIIYSNGAQTESLYLGPEAQKAIGRKTVDEIAELFPELFCEDAAPKGARMLVSGRMARKLAHRHQQNKRHLVC